MRLAGRFGLLRWHFVRRQSSHRPLRLRQGLTTAQGGTLTRVMLAITWGGTTLIIIIIGTWHADRVGSAAWRKCKRAVWPIPMPALRPVQLPVAWPRPAGSDHRTSSPKRAATSAAIPPAAAGFGAPGS